MKIGTEGELVETLIKILYLCNHMDRRHYLALSGSVAFAGCTGDPSGIVSNDSTPSNDDSSTTADSDESNQSDSSNESSDQSLIETTFDGTGQGLRETSIENSGLKFIRINTSEPITIAIVDSEGELSNRLRLSYPSVFSRSILDITRGEYALNVEPDSDVDWEITIEDHPTYSEQDVETSQFPVELSGSTQEVYGPFLLDGFFQLRLRTNATMTLRFFDQQGETVGGGSVDVADGDYSESFVDFDPTTIDGLFWITSEINARYSGAVELEDIFFDVQLVEPDNS